MPIPKIFEHRLKLPVLGAPMFLVSTPELVIAQCRAGVAGVFPSLNARPVAMLDEWLDRITRALRDHDAEHRESLAAPHGVNLIVHKSNTRLAEDAAVVVRYRVPLVITSVGLSQQIVEQVRGYGGIVFHDVTTVKHARKALDAGVDGLIIVCAGAGGHGGALSPFALVSEIREFFDGPLVLAGAIGSGRAVHAAQVLGADLVSMGTRFLATQESGASDAYKRMVMSGTAADIVYSARFSGVAANFLRESIVAAGFDPDRLDAAAISADIGLEEQERSGAKVWRDIWSAGQGIGTIHDAPPVAELVQRLRTEYDASIAATAGSRTR